ncbi:MAG TPA: hypothetical protein VGN28_04150, partial [Blastococcus sp.]|nr:hypothetical protein [Blastococcus sp.]
MTTMTNNAPATSKRTFRLGVPQRIMLLTATVAVVAVALFVVVVLPLPAPTTAVSLPWWVWAAAFAVCEALVVHVQWQREAHTYSVGDLVLGAGLILCAPHDLVIAQVIGAGATLLLYRRQRGIKLLFNVAQYALGGSIATSLVWVVSSSGLGVWNW